MVRVWPGVEVGRAGGPTDPLEQLLARSCNFGVEATCLVRPRPSHTHDNLQLVEHARTPPPQVCCNDWQHPTPSYSAWHDDDVASDGGTFGFGDLTFRSDSEVTLRIWSATNRTVLYTADVSFA